MSQLVVGTISSLGIGCLIFTIIWLGAMIHPLLPADDLITILPCRLLAHARLIQIVDGSPQGLQRC